MITETDGILLMGAIVVAAATVILAKRQLVDVRRQNSETGTKPRSLALLLIYLGVGLAVVVFGMTSAAAGGHGSVVPIVAASVAVALAAALPGVLIMAAGWGELKVWAVERSTPQPPARWLSGAILTGVAFGLFGILLPITYFSMS